MNEVTDKDELYTLICQSDLANELDLRLKSSSNVDEILTFLYERDDQRINLLMLAALCGKDEFVRILLSHSSDTKSLLELRGTAVRTNGTSVGNVTALWCACDRAHYTVARTLIDIGGASVDLGPRHSLLIDATIAGRLDTVRFLIENGYASASIVKCGSSLRLNSLIMAAIHGRTEIVAFLIEKGSEFDYKTLATGNTAIGYASMKGHLDIVRLLHSAGASLSSKNKAGWTPLMLAAKHERKNVIDYLLEQQDDEIGIKQLELAVCTLLTPQSATITNQWIQLQKIVNLMHEIFHLRKIKHLPKIIAQPIAAYAFQQECQTVEEFEKIQHDIERLRLEALMMRERILVPEKDELLFEPLLNYGDQLVSREKYEHCLDLWEHTFYLYRSMDLQTRLHRFVWVFCKMISMNVRISPQRFVQIARLAFEPSQQKSNHDYVKDTLCLLAIAVKILEQTTITKSERQLIHQWMNDLCRQKPTTPYGRTLLHLCVADQTYDEIDYRADDIKSVLK